MNVGKFAKCVLAIGLALAVPGFAAAQDKAAEKAPAKAPVKAKVDAKAAAAVKADAKPEAKAEAKAEEKKATEEAKPAEKAPEAEKAAEPAPATEPAPAEEPTVAEEPAPAEEPAVEAPVEPTPEEKPAPAADEGSPLKGTWTKKIEFATEDGSFKFQPTGFVQPKLLFHIVGDNPEPMAESGFSLHRARFGFKSTLFKIAKIEAVADFKTGTFNLVDFYGDIDPWKGVVALRAGRFRPWFGRQFMSASTQLQMIENANAWADKDLGLELDRDLGLGLFGLVANFVEYGVGVWNGDGGSVFDSKDRDLTGKKGEDGKTLKAPAKFDVLVGGRVAFHFLGLTDIGRALPLGNESIVDKNDKPALALGLSAYFNKRHDRTVGMTNAAGTAYDALYYDNQLKLGVDLAAQFKCLSVAGEFFLHKVWFDDAASQDVKDAVAEAGGQGDKTVDNLGFGAYGQVGYFILPKKLEAAVRFDMVDPNMNVRGSRMYPGIGATYYIFGNNLKVQLMYRLGISPGFEKVDPGYKSTSNDIILMLQGSI